MVERLLPGLVLLLVLMAPPASAQPDIDLIYAGAQEAERELRFGEALSAYEEVVKLDPDGARAAAAGRRIERLRLMQGSEGGFDALLTLERARRAEQDSKEQWISALRGIFESPDTPRLLWAEAGLWLVGQTSDVGSRDELSGALMAGLHDVPQGLRKRVIATRVRVLAQQERWREAAEIEAIDMPTMSAGRSETATLLRQSNLQKGSHLAWAGLILFALVSLIPALRTWSRRPRPRPMGLIPLWLILLLTAALIEGWERGLGAPMLWALLPLSAVHLLSAGAAQALRGNPVGRYLLGAMSVWATVGVLYLVLLPADRIAWLGL